MMKPEDLLLAPELSTEQVTEFLSQYGFKEPATADRNLQLMAEDFTTREMLARIIGGVLQIAQQSPDPDDALNNFERFLASLTHRANLLGFLGDTPEALEAIILVCGTSPFSAEILIRNPEYFYWMLDQLGPTWVKSEEVYLKEARQGIGKFSDPDLQLHALARFKRREMLRISARDILRVAELPATVTELSFLADTVCQLVYEVCFSRLVERYGIPQYQDSQGKWRAAQFTILGMGKLGGGELNYSSDIDLIYIYDGERGAAYRVPHAALSEEEAPSEKESPGELEAVISNVEFFTKLAQAITHELSSLTEEGYFYRVDLRLRPEGSTGNVASSLSACRNYYATWGETFERLALIKARPVAGSAGLGRAFCEAFRPFVYRKFLDFASLEEIQEIKTRIEIKLGSRKKQEAHVKLGAGGIREIEFFVQALQLIYGGNFPALQERSTLAGLDRLLEHQFLTDSEHRELRLAYLFLRDLEHKLQMVLHLQTHELPDSPKELYKCARRMGFHASTPDETIEQMQENYQTHTANVSRIFQNLITFQREGVRSEQFREAALVLNRNLSEGEAFQILTRHGFQDLKSAFHQIALLRDAPSFAHSPSKMRNLLANLMPSLLKQLETSPDPDTGLSYFERFASALGERDSFYTLLNDSSAVLAELVRILSSSPFLADYLCRHPEFLDSIIQKRQYQKRKSPAEFQTELRQALQEASHLEGRKTLMRSFQQAELFRIGTKELLGQIKRHQAGEQLAALAEACLLAALEMACRELQPVYGTDFPDWVQEHFAILALGKFGGGDLSYNSDLDLVYFYKSERPQESSEMQRRFVRLVERLDEILSISHGQGSIYKIDTRLRPEGKKGELVVSMDHYQEYLQRRAQEWERLALVRHRIIFGCGRIRRLLKRWIEAYVYLTPWASSRLAELMHIRHRMELELGKESDGQRFHLKAGTGGLIDVEFGVQLLQMKHGAELKVLRVPHTMVGLKRLLAHGWVSASQFGVLTEGYEFLRALENRLRLNSPYSAAQIARNPATLTKMARLIGFEQGEHANPAQAFEDAYFLKTRAVRQVYQQIVAGLSEEGTNL